MKKSLLVLALIVSFAAASYADVSFLTANSVGTGKWSLEGVYATNHVGAGAGVMLNTDPSYLDMTNLGLKVEYGIMQDLDLLAAYSVDSAPNLNSKWPKEFGAGPTFVSGSTTGLGLKYTVKPASQLLMCDFAVMVGYQSSVQTLSGAHDTGNTTYALSGIFSKQVGMCMPYGAIAYKQLSLNAQPGASSLAGVGLQFNIGCYIGIAANQAVAIEYNTEQDAYTDTKASANDHYSVSVSGISLGYVYMF